MRPYILMIVLIFLSSHLIAFGACQDIVFSQDGQYIQDHQAGSVATWSLDSGKLLGVIRSPRNVVESFIDSTTLPPRTIVQLDDGRIIISDIIGNNPIRFFYVGSHQAYLGYGSTLANGWQVEYGDSNTLYLVNLNTLCKHSIHLPISRVNSGLGIQFASNGRRLIAFAAVPHKPGYSIWKSDLTPGGFMRFVGLSRARLSYAQPQALMAENGNVVVAFELRPNSDIRVWRANNWKSLVLDKARSGSLADGRKVATMPDCWALSSDGSLLALCYGDNIVEVYSTISGRQIERVDIPRAINDTNMESNDIVSIGFSPDSRLIGLHIGWTRTVIYNRYTQRAVILAPPPFMPNPDPNPPAPG